MLKGILVFLFGLAGCQAVTPVASDPTSGINCQQVPSKILTCLDIPAFYKNYPEKCKSTSTSQCAESKCFFVELGWSVDNQVNKTKVAEYYDQFASEHPAWTAVITDAKASCLGDHALKPQGIYLDCEPYDITHCMLTSFLRKTSPSQWFATEECQAAREFAAVCPLCPNDCLVPEVPKGSCNACLSVPKP